MTPDELRERILHGAGHHADFKPGKTPDRTELAKDIVCFANTDGGQLIFGVSDDGVVGGVEDVGALLARVEEIAFNRCRPPVTVVPEVLAVEGHDVVVLNVAKGDQRPYCTEQGRYYVRAWRRCRQASREELLRLFQSTESFTTTSTRCCGRVCPIWTTMRSSVTLTNWDRTGLLMTGQGCSGTGV